ncbi:hypothetical protein NMY22_g14190 [Coprinellus aureogranulatus]|nr:hypothetical protein NMY22_g14190 [Coprinellus aureogranulatus]
MFRDFKVQLSYEGAQDEHPAVHELRQLQARLEAQETLRQCEISDRLCWERFIHGNGYGPEDCTCDRCERWREACKEEALGWEEDEDEELEVEELVEHDGEEEFEDDEEDDEDDEDEDEDEMDQD